MKNLLLVIVLSSLSLPAYADYSSADAIDNLNTGMWSRSILNAGTYNGPAPYISNEDLAKYAAQQERVKARRLAKQQAKIAKQQAKLFNKQYNAKTPDIKYPIPASNNPNMPLQPIHGIISSSTSSSPNH
jgi:hypothetical protein